MTGVEAPNKKVAEIIQMVDLKGQYAKIKPSIDAAIHNCLDNATFIKGPQVAHFEAQLADYLGANYVVSCGNGTDALQIAMMALELKPGDEVIVPAFTYVATAEAIGLLGLTPVMVDVDPLTFNLNRQLVEAAITPKTKLVVPVHLFGQCADVEGILDVCTAHQIAVIEDAAQAIGATYRFADGTTKKAGTLGDMGTTSFFPSKNLGCYGDGGAVYMQSQELARKARMIANHGQEKKYIHEMIGINSRLDSLQAAILTEKLRYLDEYTLARQKAASLYDAALAEVAAVKIPFRADFSTHVFHQYTLKVPAPHREGLQEYLRQRKIPSMIYYPVPLNQQKAYQHLGRVVGNLAVTQELCKQVISLPMHTEMTEAHIAYISEAIATYFS
ncbi:DegT/DnrJ/EryC1/StrS family aminotransferase [Runella salmonicolor]|uniref:DegT/DnrJ/EryC1/StrS family aminotransferase n=1 Tax=Runella salmonicolor TaxID=2950278 RepID=A0ABT1FHH8_9BACT|nr:DegT/DnrJ/EryC1/StrS family aminotransferase [Runella salmonicolor]MCP1381216.1 DegT/DnrJ/EryC1/StrS family aminotransferase [Runella salmonicolor]